MSAWATASDRRGLGWTSSRTAGRSAVFVSVVFAISVAGVCGIIISAFLCGARGKRQHQIPRCLRMSGRFCVWVLKGRVKTRKAGRTGVHHHKGRWKYLAENVQRALKCVYGWHQYSAQRLALRCPAVPGRLVHVLGGLSITSLFYSPSSFRTRTNCSRTRWRSSCLAWCV